MFGTLGNNTFPASRLGRIARFAAVGIAATSSHALTTIVLVSFLAGNPTLAMVIGTVVGVATSYLGNALWTFGATGRHVDHLPRFLLVYGVIMSFNALTMFLLEQIVGLNYLIPLAIALTISPALTFILNERYVFRGSLR
ncbi:GtrA family protein [Aquibium carbonis]|uniref:GtrA family protein n=1 Tax=Aquibium carbonis TaxID=2495581 RepID=UPI00147861D1|nr:GtrA family protein [Aquibium carbonis]